MRATVEKRDEARLPRRAFFNLAKCGTKSRTPSHNNDLRRHFVITSVCCNSPLNKSTRLLDRRKLPKKKIAKYYKMRWGVEIEYRGLKQTIDKRNLRCRNSDRVYVELDWSIRAMAFAELIALCEQVSNGHESRTHPGQGYDPKDRSLANTMRALRKCMRNLNKYADRGNDLLSQLSSALVQKYDNRTDKRARYRPWNPDKKPLGERMIRKLHRKERDKLAAINHKIAA